METKYHDGMQIKHAPENANTGPAVSLAEMMAPKPLRYYGEMVMRMNPKRALNPDIKITVEEAAAILKTHDHGIGGLEKSEVQLLYSVIGKLKDQIWS